MYSEHVLRDTGLWWAVVSEMKLTRLKAYTALCDNTDVKESLLQEM